MNLTAADLYSLFQPSECELRTWLRSHGEAETEPSEYEKLLRELGVIHEHRHLQSLGRYVDLSSSSLEERRVQTLEAMGKGEPVLYQPVFQSRVVFQGEECTLLGIPDFLILEHDNYAIRDCKISRHADEERHYETILQLGLYGFLYERSVRKAPAKLEVFLGTGTIEEIPYDGGVAALAQLENACKIRRETSEFYEPVGWSKCGSCGFQARCWRMAEDADDPARVYGIDQSLARHLHLQGVHTVEELLKTFDESSLAEIKILRGTRTTKVGQKAKDAILHAKVLRSGEILKLAKAVLPQGKNFVAFDIEGLPPELDDLDKIYLWGIQVFGERPSEYMASLSDFGERGDQNGWLDFLTKCQSLFESYGDIPFLHWHHYERTNLRKYVIRHADPNGVAARIDRNLVDLLPIAKNSFVLPEPTYSLKVVERYAGFNRSSEVDGKWSMATYIKAVETEDRNLRTDLMNEILHYNKEDLQATWAVFRWLSAF